MKALIKSVVRPVVTRFGTMLGVYFLSQGMPPAMIEQVATVATAVMFFFVDMWTRQLFNRVDK